MQITIDKKKITVTHPNKSLVQVAKENGITIPAPCYITNRKFGCCKGCIIEIDGEIQYACCTKPVDGMQIVFDQEDLHRLRRERIKQYAYNIKHGIVNECDCSEEEDSCSCGCGSDCC